MTKHKHSEVGEGQFRSLGLTHIPLYIRQITNKDVLYSTGNSTQYSIITYMGEEPEEMGYMYNRISSLLYTRN